MTTLIEDRDAEWEKAIAAYLSNNYGWDDVNALSIANKIRARLTPQPTAQDHVTIEPWMGGWRIVRDGEGLYWQWDKDTADLMADGLRWRLAKEAAKTPDEAKTVIEKVYAAETREL